MPVNLFIFTKFDVVIIVVHVVLNNKFNLQGFHVLTHLHLFLLVIEKSPLQLPSLFASFPTWLIDQKICLSHGLDPQPSQKWSLFYLHGILYLQFHFMKVLLLVCSSLLVGRKQFICNFIEWILSFYVSYSQNFS